MLHELLIARKCVIDGPAALTIRERIAIGADPWIDADDDAVRRASWRVIERALRDELQEHVVEGIDGNRAIVDESRGQ
ncbi:hypothetical protein [Burkholderia cenocepacia]|uniref:hypothetical protein n=1 Tax=Burkholderia cenocepacia TaxID=95486 RepID=UPI0012B800D9|nr:hypothetical protein [Burkholderia cenocepacia]